MTKYSVQVSLCFCTLLQSSYFEIFSGAVKTQSLQKPIYSVDSVDETRCEVLIKFETCSRF